MLLRLSSQLPGRHPLSLHARLGADEERCGQALLLLKSGVNVQPDRRLDSQALQSSKSPRADGKGFMAAVSGYVSSSEGAGGTKVHA